MTSTEIAIGAVLSDTGVVAGPTEGFRAGIDARLALQNKDEGGVYGRQISYEWLDDGSKLNLNRVASEKFVNDGKVFGLIEPPITSSDSIPLLSQKGIPVTGLGGTPYWSDASNMFSWYYVGNGSSTTWGEYIRSMGGTRLALITSSLKTALAGVNRQLLASLKASGVEIVKIIDLDNSLHNYRALAEQIKAADVDAIAGVLLPEVATQLLPELRQIGIGLGGNLKVVLSAAGYDLDQLGSGAQALVGVSLATGFKPFELNTPGQVRFSKAMVDYSPEVRSTAEDSAIYGWLAADLFIRGLEVAGPCPTRQSFITNLRRVTDYDGAGLTPDDRINLSTNYRETSTCHQFVQISPDASRFAPMNEGRPYCGTAISPQQTDMLVGTS
ncbi:ABC transporter substrate-binding protein [Frankia sp. CcI49]|uniref:ABC transporter substrate-binding protein n=1 Tax=Frankia sp. CcI49 TaxID=1745382 RepID=UPI001F525E84|nr:ABC transporter substrate-binding protein [Frankia sp. CcI49]